MLNLNRLQVLRAVLSHGSFSGAAQSLAYTQSAVSQAIGRLGGEVGAQLLVRDRRGGRASAAGAGRPEGEVAAQLIVRDRGGVRPTAAGAALAAHAETLLAQASAAEAEL